MDEKKIDELAQRIAKDLAWYGSWEVYRPVARWVIEHPQASVVVHGICDMECHAEWFNEGYETAMAQELMLDDEIAAQNAQDWLAEHDERIRVAERLRLAESMNDVDRSVGFVG